MQDRFQKKSNDQYYSQTKSSQKEGEVTIKKVKNSTKVKSKNVGEYVDFEEIDE